MPNSPWTTQQITDLVNKNIQTYLSGFDENYPQNYMVGGHAAHTFNINTPTNGQDVIVSNQTEPASMVAMDTFNPIETEQNYAGIFDIRKAYKNQFTSALILTGLTDIFHQRLEAGPFDSQNDESDYQYQMVYSPAYGKMAKNIAKLTGLPYLDNLADIASGVFPSGIEYVTNLLRAFAPLKKDLTGKNAEKIINLLNHTTSFMTPDVDKVGFSPFFLDDNFHGPGINTNLTKHGVVFPFLFMYTSLFSKESYKEVGVYDKKIVETNLFNRLLSGELLSGLDILNLYRNNLSMIPNKLDTILRMLREEMVNISGPWFTRKVPTVKQGVIAFDAISQEDLATGEEKLASRAYLKMSPVKLKAYYELLSDSDARIPVSLYFTEHMNDKSVFSKPPHLKRQIYALDKDNPDFKSIDGSTLFDFHFSTFGKETITYNNNTTSRQDMTNVYFRAAIDNINETYDANWQTKESFGRMDKMAMYVNTSRNIGLTFKLVAETPQEQIANLKRLDWLAKHSYANYYNKRKTFGFYKYPFLKMTIGGLYKDLPGYYSGIKIDVEKQAFWEDGFPYEDISDIWTKSALGQTRIPQTPMIFTITLTFNVIYDEFVDGRYQFYDVSNNNTLASGASTNVNYSVNSVVNAAKTPSVLKKLNIFEENINKVKELPRKAINQVIDITILKPAQAALVALIMSQIKNLKKSIKE